MSADRLSEERIVWLASVCVSKCGWDITAETDGDVGTVPLLER